MAYPLLMACLLFYNNLCSLSPHAQSLQYYRVQNGGAGVPHTVSFAYLFIASYNEMEQCEGLV